MNSFAVSKRLRIASRHPITPCCIATRTIDAIAATGASPNCFSGSAQENARGSWVVDAALQAGVFFPALHLPEVHF
jgi:hypothetical protein